jgi:hypothetical protein
MERKRIVLEGDVHLRAILFNDLMHRLGSAGTVRALEVRERDDLNFCVFFTHNRRFTDFDLNAFHRWLLEVDFDGLLFRQVCKVRLDLILALLVFEVARNPLFALPIVVSSLLLKKFSILVTTLCTIALYILSAWWYFHTHFNEGYKAELAIEVGFYCVFFLILAEVLWLLIRPKKS